MSFLFFIFSLHTVKICIYSQIPHYLTYYQLTADFKIRNSEFSHFFLLFQNCFGNSSSSSFHVNFRIRIGRFFLTSLFYPEKDFYIGDSHDCTIPHLGLASGAEPREKRREKWRFSWHSPPTRVLFLFKCG